MNETETIFKAIQVERNFSNYLYDQCMILKRERDEARRMYCQAMSDVVNPYRSAEDIASDREWDCFEEQE